MWQESGSNFVERALEEKWAAASLGGAAEGRWGPELDGQVL